MGHRQREGENSGQGGYPTRSAALDLRRQAARGRAHLVGLQHPEGVHLALGASPSGRGIKEEVLMHRIFGVMHSMGSSAIRYRPPRGMYSESECVSRKGFVDTATAIAS